MICFQGETSEGLYEHLEWQKNLTPFSDTDDAIATAIIDAIDEQGYLTQSTEEILEAMGNPEIELDEVEAVLKRIQHFDPVGIASRDLRECLLIQLQQFNADTPHLADARLLIDEHLDLIAARDFRTLMRKTKLKEDQLRDAINLIQSLNPRPGLLVQPMDEEYVIPDVSVWKKNGRWVVELNRTVCQTRDQSAVCSHGPQRPQSIRQPVYSWSSSGSQMVYQEPGEPQRHPAQGGQLYSAVPAGIFFEYGEEAMKPMVLNDIAEAVEMHESTISRVTTQKYMHTPRGIFELKYFFSSHVGTEDGGECSSTAIRAFIKKLVAAENQKKPLSDSKMAQLLAEQGINVARRTIAKYREAMMIPPSNQRKSL